MGLTKAQHVVDGVLASGRVAGCGGGGASVRDLGGAKDADHGAASRPDRSR